MHGKFQTQIQFSHLRPGSILYCQQKLACSKHSDTRARAKDQLIASSLVSSRFLTCGDARAYHELLQGRGYANESLALSQQTDFVINRVRTRECEDLSFPKKHALTEVRWYQNLCRDRASFAAQTQSFLCGKFSTARLEVLPNLRHGGVFQMSTMVNLGIGF